MCTKASKFTSGFRHQSTIIFDYRNSDCRNVWCWNVCKEKRIMENKTNPNVRYVVVLFAFLSVLLIVFFSATDTFQLFSVAKLSLDASGTRGNLIERGANGLSGSFDNEAKILKTITKYENKIDVLEEKIDKAQIKLESPKAEKKPQYRDRLTGKIILFDERIADFE